VRRSADDAQQLAERRGSRIEFRLPATGCFAEADRRRVERILRNILVNAVEHGEGKDVVVTTAIDSDAVAVSVRDYGVGLRPGEEQKVFDRFWRADPARARHRRYRPGPGHLARGRAPARRLAAGLGERGKGSVFRLTLPRVAGQELAGSPLPLEPDEAEVAATDLGPGARPATEITRVTSHG
jgi:Signal transduction histidine kinase